MRYCTLETVYTPETSKKARLVSVTIVGIRLCQLLRQKVPGEPEGNIHPGSAFFMLSPQLFSVCHR